MAPALSLFFRPLTCQTVCVMSLGTEVTEMCQETLDICLDQVPHLCPGVDFSAITLKSRWDPNGRRIIVPQESDEGEPLGITEVVLKQPPEPTVQATPLATRDAAESLLFVLALCRLVLLHFWHSVMPFALGTFMTCAFAFWHLVMPFASSTFVIVLLSLLVAMSLMLTIGLHNLFLCSSAPGDQSGEVP
ncbi:hypothetical protein PIB30_011059 [Stylosanthes scabra]|uniref:Uncharacterized protein n=1 Tax=Stylosanthes scabra TaxID=79078 RepID=A0ABU6X7B1_9FABA|nr:hypothetical protein [Stylosanthes scabra]